MNAWPKLTCEAGKGAFHVTYQFQNNLSALQQETMGEWLSTHCTENFIFIKLSRRIIAGGWSDNNAAWANRKNRKAVHHVDTTWEIRLHQQDTKIFLMVWGNLLDNS